MYISTSEARIWMSNILPTCNACQRISSSTAVSRAVMYYASNSFPSLLYSKFHYRQLTARQVLRLQQTASLKSTYFAMSGIFLFLVFVREYRYRICIHSHERSVNNRRRHKLAAIFHGIPGNRTLPNGSNFCFRNNPEQSTSWIEGGNHHPRHANVIFIFICSTNDL